MYRYSINLPPCAFSASMCSEYEWTLEIKIFGVISQITERQQKINKVTKPPDYSDGAPSFRAGTGARANPHTGYSPLGLIAD